MAQYRKARAARYEALVEGNPARAVELADIAQDSHRHQLALQGKASNAYLQRVEVHFSVPTGWLRP